MATQRKRCWNVILAVLLILTLCFIWGNSLLNRDDSADVSQGLMELLSPLFEDLGVDTGDDLWLRKAAHLGEFCALGCELTLLFCLNASLRWQSVCNACFCALLAALSDETLQLFSGRACMLQDVLLDFAGALIGAVLVLLILTRWKKNYRKAEE